MTRRVMARAEELDVHSLDYHHVERSEHKQAPA